MRSRIRRGLAALCVLLPGLAFAASGARPARLDQIAHIYQDKGQFSGAALVARDGKVLLDKTYAAPAGTRYPKSRHCRRIREFTYVGGEENAPMEQDTRAMAAVLAHQGDAKDVALRVNSGEDHSVEAWQLAFPDAIEWLFRSPRESPE